MTITDAPVTNEPVKVSVRDKRGRIQTITINGQTVHASELELLSKRLLDPKVQKRMRSAFGILRHRKLTMFDRMIATLRHHSTN